MIDMEPEEFVRELKLLERRAGKSMGFVSNVFQLWSDLSDLIERFDNLTPQRRHDD